MGDSKKQFSNNPMLNQIMSLNDQRSHHSPSSANTLGSIADIFKPVGNNAPQKKPAETKKQTTLQIDPFMPGMDQLLAKQLAAGFGGRPGSYLTAFNQTYAPTQVPQSFAPPTGNTSSGSETMTLQELLKAMGATRPQNPT